MGGWLLVTDDREIVETDLSQTASAGVTLKLVTTLCGASSCPTIYESDRGTVVVQGYAVSADSAGVHLPQGELLVEIPRELLAEAARLTL
jgi:hypothetical protein